MNTPATSDNYLPDLKKHKPFKLGDWHINPTTLTISNAYSQVKLEPKVMELLLLLANNQGQVVSRQRLKETIWAGTVVSYDAISKTMIKLRKALGDNSTNPAYIETIPKRGYRLVAKIETIGKYDATTIPWPIIGKFNTWKSLTSLLILTLLLLTVWQVFKYSNTEKSPSFIHETALSLTVLPLKNLSNNKEDNYFAAGLTSDLITDLAKLSHLKLIADQSQTAITFSEEQENTQVNYILSGDIIRIDDQLRINVRLQDTNNNQYLWTERYKGTLSDIFNLQDEITNKIVTSLTLTVSEQEKKRMAIRYTNNIDAYDIFLKAQEQLIIYTAETNQLARDLYQKAIKLDQSFARAYAGLALTYALDFRHDWLSDTKNPIENAIKYVQQALNLNNELPEIYWVLSYINNIQGNFDNAISYANKTLSLQPSYADAYALLTGIYTYQKEYSKAIDAMNTALTLNPGGGHLYYLLLARAQYFNNDPQNALLNLQRAYSRNPSSLETLIFLIAVNHRLGNTEDAKWIWNELQLQHPNFALKTWIKDAPFNDKIQRAQLVEDLKF